MVGLERGALPLFVLQFGSDYLTLKRLLLFCFACLFVVVVLLLLFCCCCFGSGGVLFLLSDFRLHFSLFWVCSLVKSVATFNIIL